MLFLDLHLFLFPKLFLSLESNGRVFHYKGHNCPNSLYLLHISVTYMYIYTQTEHQNISRVLRLKSYFNFGESLVRMRGTEAAEGAAVGSSTISADSQVRKNMIFHSRNITQLCFFFNPPNQSARA